MKRRPSQRSPAEYGPGTGRSSRLLQRIWDAAALARRWAHRSGDDAVDAALGIEQQLNTLRPICTAQGLSSGETCGAPAVAVAEIHAVDGCDQVGLNTDGDLVEVLCEVCLEMVRWAMATYVDDKREMASRRGASPVCATCGRPTGYLRSILAVRPIGAEWLAL
ncbi:phosphoenolpyruvate carboxylase [Mycobacterium scrofulaceum]|nr:phosphoenolpyruvate carboxylase [Mycobacterium sp. E188]OBH35934.1 phosphoenolpyruvate carboxylase [Mycobacterium sp. E183]OBH81485.1 phosphoenolpyruvate carboxylase [Mycobacterium scrofulaceum]